MKALTPSMLEVLMDCHERELLRQPPWVGVSQTQSTKGLLNRGLLRATEYKSKDTGKDCVAFFITDAGKRYLKNLKDL